MKLEDGLIKIRSFKDEDTNFILNSWLKSFRNAPFSKTIDDDLYYEVQKRVILHSLNHHDVRVICTPDDDQHILGYASFNEETPNIIDVDYVYVKSPYRKFGLAKELIKDIRSKFPLDMKLKTDVVTQCMIRIWEKKRIPSRDHFLGIEINHIKYAETFNVFKMGKVS